MLEEEVLPAQSPTCEAHFKSDKLLSESRVGTQLQFAHVFNTNKTQDWSQIGERDIHHCCDLIKQTSSSLRQTGELTWWTKEGKREGVSNPTHSQDYD